MIEQEETNGGQIFPPGEAEARQDSSFSSFAPCKEGRTERTRNLTKRNKGNEEKTFSLFDSCVRQAIFGLRVLI